MNAWTTEQLNAVKAVAGQPCPVCGQGLVAYQEGTPEELPFLHCTGNCLCEFSADDGSLLWEPETCYAPRKVGA